MADERSNQENVEAKGANGEAGHEATPLSPLMQECCRRDQSRTCPSMNPSPASDGWVELHVPREKWLEVARTLGTIPRLGFDYLSMVSAVDYMEKGFQVVYHLLVPHAQPKTCRESRQRRAEMNPRFLRSLPSGPRPIFTSAKLGLDGRPL